MVYCSYQHLSGSQAFTCSIWVEVDGSTRIRPLAWAAVRIAIWTIHLDFTAIFSRGNVGVRDLAFCEQLSSLSVHYHKRPILAMHLERDNYPTWQMYHWSVLGNVAIPHHPHIQVSCIGIGSHHKV